MTNTLKRATISVVALGALLAPRAISAPRRSCSETPGGKRVAVLVPYYGNADSADLTQSLTSLEKALGKAGYRVVRLDNAVPNTLRARLTLDRKNLPCDTVSRPPLFVLQGHGEVRTSKAGAFHVLVTHRITTEFPTDLGPMDEVTPKRRAANSVYRVTRRLATRAVVGALTQGMGDSVRTNLILATELATAANETFSPSEKSGLSSVTLPESNAIEPLLARLREATEHPEAFDTDGDGFVSNREMFPEFLATRRTGLAPWERPRPRPIPVPQVKTEGLGLLVGYNSTVTPF